MSGTVRLKYQGEEAGSVCLQYRRSDVLFPYLQQKTECDVILSCHDGSVPCHRLLLASLSPMLCSVLSGDTWDEIITIMMPDISVQELDTFLGNLYEGSKEVSSTNMELLRLFGLVVSPQQNVRKNMMATQTKSILKRDDPPIKMKSILKPYRYRKLENERPAKTNIIAKLTSEPVFGVKQEPDDAIMEDPLSMDNVEADPEDQDDTDHNTEALSFAEIKIDHEELGLGALGQALHGHQMGIPRDSRENAVQICPICKFQAGTKNPYRHLQDHLARVHFKERIASELPTKKPYICPEPGCEHKHYHDWQAVMRHYIGKKHGVLERYVKEHLAQIWEENGAKIPGAVITPTTEVQL